MKLWITVKIKKETFHEKKQNVYKGTFELLHFKQNMDEKNLSFDMPSRGNQKNVIQGQRPDLKNRHTIKNIK